MCENSGRNVYLTKRDYGKLLKIITVYIKTALLLSCDFGHAVGDYQKQLTEITNQKAWEGYLNLR